MAFDAGPPKVQFGSITSYNWTFGDGSSTRSLGPTPAHTYSSAGTYPVTLCETDSAGVADFPPGSDPLTGTSFTVDGPGQTPYWNASVCAKNTVTVMQATPSITTSQQPATATVGASIADQATVTGGDNPTGTVTFNLYNNPNGTGTPLFTDTENLVGGVSTSARYTTTATGNDYWVATYNGDSNNSMVTSGTSLEPVAITVITAITAHPSITTSQQPATATVGASIADQATVTGGDNPTGTVTFNLYNNPNGTGTPLFTDTENLVGGVSTSARYTTTATGNDYWVATYNGDSNNSMVTSGTSTGAGGDQPPSPPTRRSPPASSRRRLLWALRSRTRPP